MGWGSEWNKPVETIEFEGAKGIAIALHQQTELHVKEFDKAALDTVSHGQGFMKDGKHVALEKIYSNLKPTHDPHSNPNAHIYYECGCGAILDPCTKSFASLNNYASNVGWKIRWNEDGSGYKPHCVKCGEGVE